MSANRFFSGVVKEGEFIPHTYEEKPLSNHLSKLEGKQVHLMISKELGIRSNQQNKYLWAVPYAMIAEETGEEDVELVHKQLTTMFWYERIKIVDENGNEETVRIPKSTSGMTTVEFEEYVEKVRRWAASFLGINIPTPNEVIPESLGQ